MIPIMMPLLSLPDRLDDATHRELDRAVEEDVKDGGFTDVFDPSSIPQHACLLIAIVEHSNGILDKMYLSLTRASTVIRIHGELRDMLASAWKRKSYRDIRNLALLKTEGPDSSGLEPVTPIEVYQDLRRNLSESFEAEYRGAAVYGLYEYLTYNQNLFRTVDCPRYYAKICSIVQSSGTGKSRTLIELSKKNVIVIYMNLRGKQDKAGFPPRDLIPSQILTEFPFTEQEYWMVCYAFLIALFDMLEEYLSKGYATNAITGVMSWVRQMCDMSYPPRFTARADFFRKLAVRYEKTHADLVRFLNPRASTTAEASSTPDVNEKLDFTARVLIAYKRMTKCLEKIFAGNSDEPKLVITIDEAQILTPAFSRAPGKYRPAEVFSRIVNEYSHFVEESAVWVVFASTTSKIADFSPPTQSHNSDRIAVRGERLFRPYTQLGWDQSASGLGDIDVEDVSQIQHIAGYGRPLWLSLKSALNYPKYVLDTASYNLCGGEDFKPKKTSHVLAVFGQRFGLNVAIGHPDSIEQLEEGVESHLRICLRTTLDRKWKFTLYPSEPLLSCVSASSLHTRPEKMQDALLTLLGAVKSDMIEAGQGGELASRLLWLLAKDLFVRMAAKNVVARTPSTWEQHLVDCQMIPVVDWLEFVFGPQLWDSQGSLARNAFSNAYLNFSHWICMEGNIAGSKEGDELGLDEFTLRHWYRTSAVQCCHQQPLIDKMIPIYFKDTPENTSAQSCMPQILIADKVQASMDSKDALRSITRKDEYLSGESRDMSISDSKPLPYIAILADLGRPSSFSVTFSEEEVDDRCLRIYAAGVDATTYPFLDKYPQLMTTLQELVRIQQIPETERALTGYLNALVGFGSSATPDHMRWERGSSVPKPRPTGLG